MNTEKFTGKAEAYAKSRPSYPDEAIEYIRNLVSPDAVFADIGAGTGKLTELIARHGYKVFAVEPNADMREQLSITLAPYTNTTIVSGTAEMTTLPDASVDVITCAQAIGWFDLNAFRSECQRIGKPGSMIFSLYNYVPGDNFIPGDNRLTNKQANEMFFENPTVQEFPNPVFDTKEQWFLSYASISDSLKPSDAGYDEHIAKLNSEFDRKSVDGILRIDMITAVYTERINCV
jgi:ubiquinone/menaquinone biosynthesis C-methylase UbiE